MRYAVRARLLADSGVSAIVSDRVHYLVRPRNGALPCVVMQQISATSEQLIDGPADVAKGRMQVDCWSSNGPAQSASLAKAVRLSLNGQSFTAGGEAVLHCALIAEQDMDEAGINEGNRIYRTSLDFEVIWREPQ